MLKGIFGIKSILIHSVFITTIFASVYSNAQGKNNDCIPMSEMREIANHFTQFSNLANSDFCNDNSKNWHLISSIMFMRKTQFDADMPISKDGLFTGRFANNWYNYFIGRINQLDIVPDCPKGVIAYVYMSGSKTMYTCPAALTESFSSLDRASVMMHEARHIDGYPHITCSQGARKGLQGACDRRIAEGGSYGVTVETYAQLGKYSQGVHPALKAYARSSSVIYADEAFEEKVRIDRTENLLLLTNSLDFYQLNFNTNRVQQLGKAPAEGRIVKRSQHLILFPTDKSIKAQYVFARDEGQISQSPSDFITEYNAGTPEQKSELVDLHIGAQWSARIYKTKVTFVCDPKSQATKDILVPNNLVAASLIYPEGYARDKFSALFVTESGEVFEVGCLNKQASLKPSTTKLDQKYSRIHKVENTVVGLGADGKLYKIEMNRSTALTTPVDGNIIEIVPEQSFDFFL